MQFFAPPARLASLNTKHSNHIGARASTTQRWVGAARIGAASRGGARAVHADGPVPGAAGRRGTLVFTPPAGATIGTIAFRANLEGSLATVLPLVK